MNNPAAVCWESTPEQKEIYAASREESTPLWTVVEVTLDMEDPYVIMHVELGDSLLPCPDYHHNGRRVDSYYGNLLTLIKVSLVRMQDKIKEDWGVGTRGEKEVARRLPASRPEHLSQLQRDLQRTMDRFIKKYLGELPSEGSPERVPVDIIELEHEIIILADLPGLEAKDIKITTQENTLRIQGRRKAYNGHYHMRERWDGDFDRDVVLPSQIPAEQVRAIFTNGIIEIHLAKATKPTREVELLDLIDSILETDPTGRTAVTPLAARDNLQALKDEEAWPSDKEFPNGFYAEDLTKLKRRNYLVVVKLSENRVERIIESPRTDTVGFQQLQQAMVKTLSVLRGQYPSSQYDIVLGQGNLRALKNGLPTISGWEGLSTEKLQV